MRIQSSTGPFALLAGFQEGPSINNLMASVENNSPDERSAATSLISPLGVILNLNTTTAFSVVVSSAGN